MDKDAFDTLQTLMQLDVDAAHAYSQAIDRIEHRSVREHLTAFRADHERHVSDLSKCISRLGGQPPEREPDVRGLLIDGFTALRSLTGTERALKAMKSNEEATNRHYRAALTVRFPLEIHALVERNFADEKRHLEYVEQSLADRIWEQAA